MRALFIETLDEQKETHLVEGDSHHHLSRVTRSRVGDSILVLNGQGLTAQGKIITIDRNSTLLSLSNFKKTPRTNNLSMAIGLLKKDALDDVIKMSVEVGIDKLYLVKSQYSQRYEPNWTRLKKIQISALEQSNNPYLPKIEIIENLQELKEIAASYEHIYFFTPSAPEIRDRELSIKGPLFVLIGPEGGFSSEEEGLISMWPQVELVSIQGPIMRAPTAMTFAAGYVLSRR